MKYPLKVSVLIVTYNHEKYIKEALESIIMQRHDFSQEIIVADDCSSDNTLEIIEEFAEKHENIKILPTTNNLGITKNYKRGFAACSGEYIAVLEGDDYWTSPHKISTMVKFLDDNRGCALAFNRFIVAETDSKRFNIQPWPIREKFQLITISDLIQDNMIGNFSTCVYRNENIKNIDPSLYDFKVYDWMFNMVNAQFGLIGYIPEVMSVYRLHPNGTWTQKTEIEKINDIITSIDEYNKYFNYIYDNDFQAHKNRLLGRISEGNTPPTSKQKLKQLIISFTPPFILSIVKLIMPPKVIEIFKK
ncbi:glycosyltransferase family 2 protein [Paenibacillus alvei]|uniref:Glycosyltransferase n=1 Tax=Paenibacillus alvei TaxID=44250 RepID=A0AAP7A710_PAEAL|nr:glycosyltransferase [Paenibacillus alvei]NOJ73712.1 glycosyltransferase [Paenibacillus alvei]